MEKIFGDIKLTWLKVIIIAILAGVITAVVSMLPFTKDTSFSDIAVTFEVWIFFGIFIIMNSKSALDSALKCFVFFLISQPLVYLVQDVINHSNLFMTYYGNWIIWTVATFPMGFVGYYMKKDKWWGLAFILTPMLAFLGYHFSMYLSEAIFSFPRHLLTALFCLATLIIYPIGIFKNKKIKIAGVIISSCIIVTMIVISLINPSVYDTTLLSSGSEEGIIFDDSYKAYLSDASFGETYFKYEDAIESWLINVKFRKAGNVDLIVESPSGEKTVFEVEVKRSTYDIKRK